LALIDELGIKPDPDFKGRIRKVLLLQGEPDRVPFYELFADKPIKDEILGKPTMLPSLLPFGEPEKLIPNEIEFWYRLGYDYVPAAPAYGFGMRVSSAPDTAEVSQGVRFWMNESGASLISNRGEFENYYWPEADQCPLELFDAFAEHLPEGMVVFGQTAGVFENVVWLLGHQGLAFMMADDPELLQMIFDKVGRNLARLVERMAEREFVGAIQMGDDLGFKTHTTISPAALRRYVFPWQKKAVEAAHKHGKPFILHSCGNLEKVMDDLIGIGINAKHSFEDEIIPVSEAKKKWGKRIAILGGLDMDFLCRASPEQVEAKTRNLLEECAPGGGYALGTGNTVANYIPVKNFLAMLKAGWRFGKYPL